MILDNADSADLLFSAAETDILYILHIIDNFLREGTNQFTRRSCADFQSGGNDVEKDYEMTDNIQHSYVPVTWLCFSVIAHSS